MQRLFILIAFILSLGCEPPARPGQFVKSDKAEKDMFITADEVSPDEEYVMITTAVNLPLYVNHDQKAFLKWGKKMGVRTSILGPAEWDVPAQISTIEQVIPGKPAGLLINGTDPGIAQAIRKAVANLFRPFHQSSPPDANSARNPARE